MRRHLLRSCRLLLAAAVPLGACGEDRLVEDTTADHAADTALADGGSTSARADGGASPASGGPGFLEPIPAGDVPVVDVADPRRGPPYPVVLVHGLNGFRDVGPLDYFFRVPGALEQDGHQVFVTAVAPYHGSAHRAALLAPQIDAVLQATGARKVNLVAHSQGGLDSRHLISTLGYGDRVASLTTVSTPHRGTRVAETVLAGDVVPGFTDVLNGYAALFGAVAADAENDPDARAALETLTPAGADAFNARNVDDPRVAYFSWAGRTNLQRADEHCGGVFPNPSSVDAIEPALLGTWTLLAGDLLDPNPNDGLVGVDSARWGRFMGCVPADHLDEIGQLADLLPELVSGWDHVAFYVEWVRYLRANGF